MKNYKIVDDLFDKKYCDDLEQTFLQQDFKWVLSASLYTCPTKETDKYNLKDLNEYLLFVHDFHKVENGQTVIKSDKINLIYPIFDVIDKESNSSSQTIFRSKANLQTQYTNNKKENFNTPHTDLDIPHKVALFYVNDSDGDTILFDDDSNIIERVTPKKGRILFFDGDILHTSSHPVNSMYRMCVNINYND